MFGKFLVIWENVVLETFRIIAAVPITCWRPLQWRTNGEESYDHLSEQALT